LKSTEKYTFIKTPMETPLTMPEKHNEIDPYVLEWNFVFFKSQLFSVFHLI